MSLAMMMLLQAAASPPPLQAIDFDLGRYRPADEDMLSGRRTCDRSDPSAIVVCARRQGGAYPLEEMARLFEPGRLIAETRLAPGVMGDVHVEAGPASDRGVTPQRVMVRARIPF